MFGTTICILSGRRTALETLILSPVETVKIGVWVYQNFMNNKFPKIILVAMGSPCNAKCPHCPCTVKPSIRDTEDKFFSERNWQKLIDECEGKRTAIRMSGYGEPLLNPRIFDMIEYGKSKGVRMSLITNGSLFTKAKIRRIMAAEIDSIEVSIDTHRELIYMKLRHGLNFKKTKQNLLDLVSVRNEVGAKTCIMASIIDQPRKNPTIMQSAEYWSQIVDKVMVRKYVTWGVLPEEHRQYLPKEWERGPCPYPYERLMIDPDGYFRLCPYDDQKLVPAFGHLDRDSVKDVWLGKRFSKIRRNHSQGKFRFTELCNKCVDWAQRSWTENYRKALRDAQEKL